jgi:hypothetical protein
MADYCYHDVHVTGNEKLMAEIGRRVDAEWLWAAKEVFEPGDAVVIGQNVFFRYETKGVRLSEVERIALEFPTARVFHLYQEPNGQVRGIAIYEAGQCTSLREVTGQPFETDDWMSFEEAVETA